MTTDRTGMVSFRGLQKGFEATPLRHFKGKFGGFEIREVAGRFPGTRVDLNFSDIEVILSTEPYQFPIAQISIRYSDRENSAWGIFAQSCTKLLPENLDIGDCVGKVMELLLTPGHKFGFDQESGEEIIRDCWECQSIEGVGEARAGNPMKRALELLDGKIEQDWNQVVFTDPLVKGDATLVNSILQRTFLPAQQQLGIISKDEAEVWHVNWDVLGGA
jgi:hypothetical protein